MECQLCSQTTHDTGTGFCVRCGELNHRVQEDPVLAMKILLRLDPSKYREIAPTDGYENLRSKLGELPPTWYPDLIRALVEAAYRKNVFVPGGASRLIQGFEKANGRDRKEGS